MGELPRYEYPPRAYESIRLARPLTEADLRQALKVEFESSPVSAVGTWRSPVLLIHGDDDRNVQFSQTTGLVQLLRAHARRRPHPPASRLAALRVQSSSVALLRLEALLAQSAHCSAESRHLVFNECVCWIQNQGAHSG